MVPRFNWSLLGLVLIAAGTMGQEKGDKNVSAPRPDANTVEIRFADDSTVKVVLQHTSVDVTTRYGKLSVPIAELRRIEFGLRIPEETAKRISADISNLGSADFKQREAASTELIALRELAYPALQQAARSDVPEIANHSPHVVVEWSPGHCARSAADVASELLAGDPPIAVLAEGERVLRIAVWTLRDDEHQIVARRIAEVLRAG